MASWRGFVVELGGQEAEELELEALIANGLGRELARDVFLDARDELDAIEEDSGDRLCCRIECRSAASTTPERASDEPRSLVRSRVFPFLLRRR